jgi:hypothetical protein
LTLFADVRTVYRHGDAAAQRALSPALTMIENRLQQLVVQHLKPTAAHSSDTTADRASTLAPQHGAAFRDALHRALGVRAQTIGVVEPTNLTCIEPFSSSGFAERVLTLASEGRTILCFPLPELGLVAVCAALASRAPPISTSTLLPVQYGLTNFLKHVHPTLTDPNASHVLYEVGDKLLGATTQHDVTILVAPTASAPTRLVATRDVAEVADDGKRVHLAVRTVSLHVLWVLVGVNVRLRATASTISACFPPEVCAFLVPHSL